MSGALNPDIRGADEVVVPDEYKSLCGWADLGNEVMVLAKEQKALEQLQESLPERFATQEPVAIQPGMIDKWEEFQQSKGRFPGSMDLSLLDEFVHGQPLLFKRQLIGSCVVSNTLRPWATRLMYQVVLLGQPMEYLGRNEFGPENYLPFGPMSYGLARKRANMRGSDGLYCGPMTESLMKDGVLQCNTPKLIEFMKNKGFSSPQDWPEPQGRDGMRLYRDFGNWKHIDQFRQYLDYPLLESPRVTSADQLWDLALAGKPAFVCSMEAIHKVGEHSDGFAIHARNPRSRWAHNMSFQGVFVASDGERFFRESNESWGPSHIYNRHFDEVAASFRNGRLTVQALGQIEGPAATIPQMA